VAGLTILMPVDEREPLDAPPHPAKTKDEVVRRAFAMRALVYRVELELQSQGSNFAENQVATSMVRETVVPALQENDLWDELTAFEQQTLTKPVGSWQPAELFSLSWLSESLSVLIWSLGILDELQPWDTMMDPSPVLTLFDLAGEDSGHWVSSVELRDAEEIADAQFAAEIWHWRGRTQAMLLGLIPFQAPQGQRADEFLGPILQYTAEEAEKSGILRRIDGDFPAYGQPYRNARDQQFHLLMSIASERHHALNWLVGFGLKWDDVSMDT